MVNIGGYTNGHLYIYSYFIHNNSAPWNRSNIYNFYWTNQRKKNEHYRCPWMHSWYYTSFNSQHAQAFFILKILGGLYLLYLGIGMLKSKADLNFNDTAANDKKSSNNSASIITRGILINLLNPKLTLFFFSFLPQYISINSDSYIKISFLLGLAFMFITLIVFIGYGMLAGLMKSFFVNSPKRVQSIQNIFGIIFIIFAVKLSTSSM